MIASVSTKRILKADFVTVFPLLTDFKQLNEAYFHLSLKCSDVTEVFLVI